VGLGIKPKSTSIALFLLPAIHTHVRKKEKKMEILYWKATIIMSCLKNRITVEGMSMEHLKIGFVWGNSGA